jgi:hypothetical protein
VITGTGFDVPDASDSPTEVPDELQLSAFHEAFAVELEAMLANLPLAPTARVLDLACGDGFYTRRLTFRAAAFARRCQVRGSLAPPAAPDNELAQRPFTRSSSSGRRAKALEYAILV